MKGSMYPCLIGICWGYGKGKSEHIMCTKHQTLTRQATYKHQKQYNAQHTHDNHDLPQSWRNTLQTVSY